MNDDWFMREIKCFVFNLYNLNDHLALKAS